MEKRLVVLERNALLYYGSLASLIGGGLLVASGLANLFRPGVVGVVFMTVGLIFYLTSALHNQRPVRRAARVGASREGVTAPSSAAGHPSLERCGLSSC